MSRSGRLPTVISVGVLGLAIFSRWIPHPDNVTPMMAAALLTGLLLGRERWLRASTLIALAMIISDSIVGFHPTAPFVYAGMALSALITSAMRGAFEAPTSSGIAMKATALRFTKWVGLSFFASAAGSFVFFVLSNFGVWILGALYPMTFAGLVECYAMAVPFLIKSLVGDLSFGTLILTLAAATIHYSSALKLRKASLGPVNAQ